MKLKDLHEVSIVPGDQPMNFDVKTLVNGIMVGRGEGGMPILKYTIGSDVIFSLDEKTFLFCLESTAQSKKTLFINRSYTLPDYRMKGLSTALYAGLLDHGYTLVSDYQLSEQSLRVWKHIALRYSVHAYNSATHQHFDLKADGSDWDKVYDATGTIRLVAEANDQVFESNGHFIPMRRSSPLIGTQSFYTLPSSDGIYE